MKNEKSRIIVRSIAKGEGADFLAMQKQLDTESNYMLLLPEERTTTAEESEQFVEGILAQDDFLFVALDDNGKIAGYILAEQGIPKKISLSAYIVIGLQQSIQRKGIGTIFFHELNKWAHRKKLKRLELTVIAENTGAVALYKKAGFEIEGTKKCAIFQEGAFLDEYYMSKILE